MEEKYKEKSLIVSGEIEDISAMLVSAIRYALGRRTYIAEWTCNFIKNNTHLLTDKDKEIIIGDIERQKEYGYGDECDKKCWLELLKYLKEKMNE